jgi:transmembrane sensor
MSDPLISDVEGVQLTRYFAGECSPSEASAVAAWIEASPPARRALIDSLAEAWQQSRQSADGWNVPAAWAALRARHHLGRAPQPVVQLVTPSPKAGPRPEWRHTIPSSPWVRGALAAAAIVAIAWVARIGTRGGTDVAMRGGHTYVTAPGERLNVTLADGTQFVLAPASRLLVPATYHQSRRDIVLEGEAFFRVTHDARHPFRVRSGDTETTDVGTAFDIRAYHGDSDVAIAVIEGRVTVAASQRVALRSAALAAGDVASVTPRGQITRSRPADLMAYTAWTRGELVFNDLSLRVVADRLERWYDVTIVIADPRLAAMPIRATYDAPTREEVLASVVSTVGAHYEQAGRTITITRDH